MAKPRHSCQSPSRKITDRACTPICRSGMAVSLCLQAMAMPVCLICAFILSAVSSSMQSRSTLFPTHQPTATSVWFRVMKRLCCLPTLRVTAPHLAAFHTVQAQRPSALKSASPMRWLTRISAMLRCSWRASMGSKTRSIPAKRWIRTFTTCRQKNWPKCQLSAGHSAKHWNRLSPITPTC